MTHHRHFVQSWLSVENDNVVVSYVALDFVSDLELQIRSLGMESKIDPLSSVSDDVFGTLGLGRLTQFIEKFFDEFKSGFQSDPGYWLAPRFTSC